MSVLLQGLCLKLGLDPFLQYSSKPMAGATTKSASEPMAGTPYKTASETKAGANGLQNFAFVFEPMPVDSVSQLQGFQCCEAQGPTWIIVYVSSVFLSKLLFEQLLSPQAGFRCTTYGSRAANWVAGG